MFNNSVFNRFRKIDHFGRLATMRGERRQCSQIFEEMRHNLPAANYCYKTKLSYRLDFDHLYSIIQPVVEKRFLSGTVKSQISSAILVMLENGIQLKDKSEKNVML